jgi:hypothetical protein
MADFTIDDLMADIIYDYDDRSIYNDIRSQIGISSTDVVVDESEPATYVWRRWQEYHGLPAPGYTTFRYFTATQGTPLQWRLRDVTANLCYDDVPPYGAYSDFTIDLIDTNETLTKAIELKNTGTHYGTIGYTVEYKVLVSEAVEVTHEEVTWATLTVRAIDQTSIELFGRRTMNLVWPTGASQAQMQAVVDRNLDKYAYPRARLTVKMLADTEAKQLILAQAELSKDVQVVCTRLGLNDAFWIDSIQISASQDGYMTGVLGLVDKSALEEEGLFIIDTSEIDGTDLLG